MSYDGPCTCTDPDHPIPCRRKLRKGRRVCSSCANGMHESAQDALVAALRQLMYESLVLVDGREAVLVDDLRALL